MDGSQSKTKAENAHAVVLVNLGTPASPDSRGVRVFLRHFLSDARVVELPRLLWLPILYLFILTLRPRRVALLYQKIWTSAGSPLLAMTVAIATALDKKLRASNMSCHVRYAMCYSAPKLAQVMDELMQQDVSRILLLPLYPQYSGTTTAAIFDQYTRWSKRQRVLPELTAIRDYHDHPAYIKAMTSHLRRYWTQHGRAERVLLSFHGLPVRCVVRGDLYQQQCFTSAHLLAESLQLKEHEWQIAFQSRFGVAPWIKPYTDDILRQWASEGLASVDVFCPGFATDCLETLEEIAMQNKRLFKDYGGGKYRFIPCLNDLAEHIELFAQLAQDRLGYK